MFGCDDAIEANVQDRLFAAGADIFHPLIMPGILVELERVRHVKIIDKSVGAMETKIAELDSIADQMGEEFGSRAAEQRNYDRRTAWLDTAYLQTGLITWSSQLEKLRHCITKLDGANTTSNSVSRPSSPHYRTASIDSLVTSIPEKPISTTQRVEMRRLETIRPPRTCKPPIADMPESPTSTECDFAETSDDGTLYSEPASMECPRATGERMVQRIQAIEEEYMQKIRDCTMRLDGMSMATQWVGPSLSAFLLAPTNPSIGSGRNEHGHSYGHQPRLQAYEIHCPDHHGFPSRHILRCK